MAEDENPAAGTDAQTQEARPPGMQIVAQYIKDLSFENPNAPGSLSPDLPQPNISLEVELNARGRTDGLHEVEMKLMATSAREGQTVYHIEVVYAGLFAITGIEADKLEAALLIECPRYLFPFARRVIADLTAEGGMPTLRVDPIDFAAIYLQRREQVQRAGAQPSPVLNS